jgi:glycosyltransferase involved in cell wall biosynthesis
MEERPLKKKILIICDTAKWAWAIKSKNLQRYLSDEFTIEIVYLDDGEKIQKDKEYDIYLTFSLNHLWHVKSINPKKLITGSTSHQNFHNYINARNLNDRCAAIHMNSMFLYNLSIKNKNHKNIFYCPNGVDTKLFVPREKKLDVKNLVVGFVGKNNENKGLRNFIIPAVKKLEGVTLKTITNTWKNAIENKNLVDYYNSIDLYIISSDFECTPNPALEAAACGKPLISTKVGNMPEFIHNAVSGYLIDRKINLITDRISYLQKNPSKIIKMGREARKKAEEWDWKIQAENYRKMFRDVISKQ